MQSTYTLDGDIVEYLHQINETMNKRKYWTSFTYNATFESLKVAIDMIKYAYKRKTGTTLEETSRRLFEGVQAGGIETFISYYNGFLFVRKLEDKLRWHQKYGNFPEQIVCK